MRVTGAMVALLTMATPVWADWVQLTGAEIAPALIGPRWSYADGANQRFFENGETPYNAGRPSLGYWRVTGDQYCSQWPPSEAWDCYDVFRDAEGRVRFLSAGGAEFFATAGQ